MEGLIYAQTTPPDRNSNRTHGWGTERQNIHAILEKNSRNYLISEVKIGRVTDITIFDYMRPKELYISTSIKSSK